MVTVENSVGRLVQICQADTVLMHELTEGARRFQAVLDRHGGHQVVLVTDWRRMRVLSPDVSETLVAIMRSDNDRVERQAVVLPQDSADASSMPAILGMQIRRLFQEGGGKDRAAFTNPDLAVSWLTAVLSIQEVRQLRRFLGRPEPAIGR